MPMPSPGPGEVLAKINAVSLNYRDTEGKVRRRGLKMESQRPGGVVSTFVPEHKTGQLNEAVLKTSLGLPEQGVLATHQVFREGPLVRAPERMSHEEACTLPIASVTACMAITGIQETKGVSVAGLLLGKALGAQVISISSSNDKLARAKELGANFGKYVMETGGSQTLGKSFACAAYGGLINCNRYTSGKTQAAGEQQNVNVLAISRCLTLKGFLNGPINRFEEMARSAEEKCIHPVVCKTFGFGEAKEAFKYMEAGSHFGKIVIKVGQ
ncbi:hypothetical protein BJY04DRAFT_209845 [Aspergillus karnatakaensis]|uniref:zinc-dependent alcohol dehydrogenase family protein n=1 Tax=Aspergillus karnatakaensis TaxID=1810916 RepID=UPI003CCE14D5